MGKATIKDVAKKANVSITTVSFVLNNKAEHISPETIEAVKKACKELNFERNHIASSLKSKTTNTIGLIVPEIDNNYYSRIVSEVDALVSEKGYILLTAFSSNDFEREISLLYQMVARQVDYLLLLPSSAALNKQNSQKLLEVLNELPIKFVILDRKTKLNHHTEVVNDDIEGGQLASEYLVQQGYKRIACITGPEEVSSSDDRLIGYRSILEKYNIPFDETLIYVGDYSFNTAINLATQILNRNDIDAIFAFNDMSAYAAYFVSDKMNRKVGQDISIVGFDDNAFSSLITPALTSIRQDIKEICRVAVEELFKEDNTRQVIKIKPRLMERESVKK